MVFTPGQRQEFSRHFEIIYWLHWEGKATWMPLDLVSYNFPIIAVTLLLNYPIRFLSNQLVRDLTRADMEADTHTYTNTKRYTSMFQLMFKLPSHHTCLVCYGPFKWQIYSFVWARGSPWLSECERSTETHTRTSSHSDTHKWTHSASGSESIVGKRMGDVASLTVTLQRGQVVGYI